MLRRSQRSEAAAFPLHDRYDHEISATRAEKRAIRREGVTEMKMSRSRLMWIWLGSCV